MAKLLQTDAMGLKVELNTAWENNKRLQEEKRNLQMQIEELYEQIEKLTKLSDFSKYTGLLNNQQIQQDPEIMTKVKKFLNQILDLHLLDGRTEE